METVLIILGVFLWLASVVFLGKLCALTDEKAPRKLSRRPNVRLVKRDENEAA